MIKKLTKRFRRKTASEISADRVAIERLSRFNPLRYATPEYIRAVHEEFNAGRLRNAARLWDAMERTDDVCQVAASKRKKAVSRHGYEVIADDDSPEAKRHAEALKFFYDQLTTTRVDDRNIRGGMPLLVRNMMDAEGKRYSVHEIVYKVIGGKLTAEMIFAPLWYFENTTGELRLLQGLSDLDGEPLMPGGWLINSGSGVMEAVAAAYMFKHMPLQDWLLYSEGFGRPIPKGKSAGQPGSKEWLAMEAAVGALANCDGVVISSDSELEALSLETKGNLPQPGLVDRMDRAIASLWRGADLGTISKGDGTGASLQEDETSLLEDDDAQNITDVLNEQVDKYVIKFMFGTDAPKAWVKVKGGVREDTEADLKIDKQLDEMGFETPIEDLQRRYNRPSLRRKGTAELANERPGEDEQAALLKASRDLLAEAIDADLMPIVERMTDILDNTPDEELLQTLQKFQTEELPELAAQLLGDTDSESIKAMDAILSAALLNGLADAGSQSTEDGDQK